MADHGMTGPKARRVIDAIERTPLAVPMALVTASAAAFLAFAVPTAIVARGLGATGFGPLVSAAVPFGAGPRAVLMLVAAAVAGAAVWWLFHRLEHPAPPAVALDVDLFAPEAAIAPPPQLRRADAHPDAPPRRPLFAASDLGSPLDDVAGEARPFGRPPLFTATAADRAEPEVLLLDEHYWSGESLPDRTTAAPAPAPATTQQVSIAEPDPALATESIAGLMARLERGLERRGDAAGGTQPVVPDGHLRHALEELRRMTTGR